MTVFPLLAAAATLQIYSSELFILPLSSQRFSSQYEEKDPSLAVWPKSDSCERHTRMAFANARYPEDEVCAEEDKGEMPTFVLKTAGKLAKTAK